MKRKDLTDLLYQWQNAKHMFKGNQLNISTNMKTCKKTTLLTNAKLFTFILDQISKEINHYQLRKFNIKIDLMIQKVKII